MSKRTILISGCALMVGGYIIMKLFKEPMEGGDAVSYGARAAAGIPIKNTGPSW